MKVIIAAFVTLALTGCATNQYDQYTAAQVKIAEQQAIQAKYRYEALALMGTSGGDAAKVAAIMSLTSQGHQQQQILQAPKTWQDSALQWASIIVPGLTQLYSINATKATSVSQIEASVKTSANQTGAFVEFGRLINDPTIVTQPSPVIVTQPPPLIVNPQIVQPQVVTR